MCVISQKTLFGCFKGIYNNKVFFINLGKLPLIIITSSGDFSESAMKGLFKRFDKSLSLDILQERRHICQAYILDDLGFVVLCLLLIIGLT
jgi:hypothetical protein